MPVSRRLALIGLALSVALPGQALAPNDSHMTIKRDFGVAGDPEGERAARFILD